MIRLIRRLIMMGVSLSLVWTVPARAQPSPSSAPISVGNVTQVRQIKMIGHGSVDPILGGGPPQWFPDGRHVVTPTAAGVWVFDVSTPSDQGKFFENARLPMAISSDSRRMAFTKSSATERQVMVVDVATGQPDFDQDYPGQLYGLAFSPDNNLLILSGNAKKDTTEVWAVATGNPIQAIPFPSFKVQYMPQIALLALFGSNEIQLWDLTAWKLQRRIKGAINGNSVLTPDASTVISYTNTGLAVINSANGHQVQIGKDYPAQFSLSPDGTLLAVPSPDDDSQILLWKVKTNGALRYLKGHTASITELAYSPDGRLIDSSSSDDTTRIWDANTGQALRQLEAGGHNIANLAFSPNSALIAGYTAQGQLMIWDVATAKSVAHWDYFYDGISSIAVNGSLLAATSAVYSHPVGTASFLLHSVLLFWRLDQDTALAEPDVAFHPPTKVYFSADGTRLIAVGNQVFRLWDSQNVSLLNLWNFGTDNGAALNMNGTMLVTGGIDDSVPYNGTSAMELDLWDTATGRLINRLPGGLNDISDVVFSPDGKTLAAAYCGSSECQWLSPDQRNQETVIRLWNAETGELLQTLQGFKNAITTLAFSHDGKTLVSGDADGDLILWDSQTGKQLTVITTETPIASFAISRDDSLIASASWNNLQDRDIMLWDSASGKHLATLTGNAGSVTTLLFSPDGSDLFSAGQDGTIRVWAIPGG